MIDVWLPIIGAFVLGIVSTLVSVGAYAYKKQKEMREDMSDLPNPEEISEEELGLD